MKKLIGLIMAFMMILVGLTAAIGSITAVAFDTSGLLTMSNSDLINFFYSKVDSTDLFYSDVLSYSYSYPIYPSVSSLEEAITIVTEKERNDNTYLSKDINLGKETDYYFTINCITERNSLENENNTDIKEYLFFKKSVIDPEKTFIDVNFVNTKEKMKELLNSYCAPKNMMDTVKMLYPTINENSRKYEYFFYHFETTLDKKKIQLYKTTVTVNKTSGIFSIIDSKIREVKS